MRRVFSGRRIGAIAGVLASAMLMVGCSTAGGDPNGDGDQPDGVEELSIDEQGVLSESVSITLAVSGKLAAYTDLFMAQEWGEFEARNLEVNFEFMGSNDALVLLATGDIDVAGGGINAGLFNTINAGSNIRVAAPGYVAPAGSGGGWYVSTAALDGREFEPSMLEGQTIAGSQGTHGSMALGLYDLLDPVGLSIADVDVTTLASGDVPIAVQNGSVFGGAISAPLHIELEEAGEIVHIGPAVREGWPASVFFFGSTLLDENPLAGQAFFSAIMAARDRLAGDYLADPELSAEVSTALETPEDALVRFEFPTDSTFPDEFVATYQSVWRQVPDQVLYDGDLAYEDVIDTTAFEWAMAAH